MKKSAINGLIALAALALAGSVAVQCAWIYRAYRQQEDKMVQQVNEALRAAVEGVNTADNLLFMAQSGMGDSSSSRIIHFVTDRADSILDSTMEEVGTKSVNVQTLTLEVSSDTENGDSPAVSDSVLEYVMKMEAEGQLQSIVKRITRENRLIKSVWHQRLDSAQIAQELRKQMEARLPRAGFEYAVTNKNGKTFEDFASPGYASRDKGVTAVADLFPQDLRRKDVFLTLHVPMGAAAIFSEIWLLLAATLIFTLLMAAGFTVTLRNLMSQSRLNGIKADFINNMSHELKTPLATIRLAADAIRHPAMAGNAVEVAVLLDTIRNEQQRMHSHVERVLQIASGEKVGFVVEKCPTDLVQLIREAISEFDLILAAASAKISFKAPETLVTAAVDRVHLKAALANLIDNAIKYVPEKPFIEVNLSQSSTGITILVQDNGPGITNDDRPFIFDRFYRARSGDVHNTKGFGLGLSHVKQVCEAHGGRVDFSIGTGGGSVFKIQLPHS